MDYNSTMFWYLEYLKDVEEFRNKTLDDIPDIYGDIRKWIRYAAGKDIWEFDMRWVSENYSIPEFYKLQAFRFQVGLRNYETPNAQRDALRLFRNISRQYPEFNITTYHPYYSFADSYLIIAPNTYQNLGMAIACMIIIAMVLIPSVPCAVLIAVAIISIDIGVIGYMTFWGVNLDFVSMITLDMSTGFAVDLSAHISYAYVKAEGTSNERVIRAVETLGWAVVQGALSTILGMIALVTLESYLIQTFFKCVFLVISFGLIHSLLFLPVALAVFHPDDRRWTHCSEALWWRKLFQMERRVKESEQQKGKNRIEWKNSEIKNGSAHCNGRAEIELQKVKEKIPPTNGHTDSKLDTTLYDADDSKMHNDNRSLEAAEKMKTDEFSVPYGKESSMESGDEILANNASSNSGEKRAVESAIKNVETSIEEDTVARDDRNV